MKTERIPIEGSSFFTDDSAEQLVSVPGTNRALMSVAVEVARYANGLLRDLPVIRPHVTPQEKQRVIAAALFVRLLECFESILLLASHGVREELRSLFRVFLDAYFVLANVCSDAAFVSKYLQSEEAERLKLLNAAARHDHPLFNAVNEFATPEIRAALKEKIDEEGIQAFNSFANAERVGCSTIYDSMYRLTGPSVHTGPRILEDYVDFDPDGTATKIIHHGNPEVVDRFVYDATVFSTRAMRGLLECFGDSDAHAVAKLEEQLQRAMPNQDAKD